MATGGGGPKCFYIDLTPKNPKQFPLPLTEQYEFTESFKQLDAKEHDIIFEWNGKVFTCVCTYSQT